LHDLDVLSVALEDGDLLAAVGSPYASCTIVAAGNHVTPIGREACHRYEVAMPWEGCYRVAIGPQDTGRVPPRDYDAALGMNIRAGHSDRIAKRLKQAAIGNAPEHGSPVERRGQQRIAIAAEAHVTEPFAMREYGTTPRSAGKDSAEQEASDGAALPLDVRLSEQGGRRVGLPRDERPPAVLDKPVETRASLYRLVDAAEPHRNRACQSHRGDETLAFPPTLALPQLFIGYSEQASSCLQYRAVPAVSCAPRIRGQWFSRLVAYRSILAHRVPQRRTEALFVTRTTDCRSVRHTVDDEAQHTIGPAESLERAHLLIDPTRAGGLR
jgi:hypothetical protein